MSAFVLMIYSICAIGSSDTPFGPVCVDGKFKHEYLINTHPCWDDGMNFRISEDGLKKYKNVYRMVSEPSGGILICPGKSRFKRMENI